MWIKEPGKINDNLDFLGTYDNCVYILKGDEYMIIGGGIAAIAPTLERQLSNLQLEPEKVKYLLITHSHFDHCGAVPYLKQKFPHLKIIASAYAAELLVKEKVIDTITQFNKRIIDLKGLQAESEKINLQFKGIEVDHIVKENDVIELGDEINVHIVEAPGHTKCSIAAYVPKLQALFPSDSVPLPSGSGDQPVLLPSPQYSYSMFLNTVEKLSNYEIQICGFEHQGIFTGEQAKQLILDGLDETISYKNNIVEMYNQLHDLEQITQHYVSESMQKRPADSLDENALAMVCKSEIKSVLRDAGLID